MGQCAAVAPRRCTALFRAHEYDLNAVSDGVLLCCRVLYSVTLSPAAPELSTAFCVFQQCTWSYSVAASCSNAWCLDARCQATRQQHWRTVSTQLMDGMTAGSTACIVPPAQVGCKQALRGRTALLVMLWRQGICLRYGHTRSRCKQRV